MILSELLNSTGLENRICGDAKSEVNDICFDSRVAKEGSFFFCLVGASSDGHLYAKNAYDSGCRIFAVERDIELPDDAVRVYFYNTREALAYVSAEFFGRPADEMRIIGITGTKGKTTIANMLAACLNASGVPCGYIGTSGIEYAGKHFETKNTTPESFELHRTFRQMLECGVKTAVIEVSSQALFNYRVCGISFFAGVFTNLSPDHIGPTEHPNFEHYKLCKKKLFSMCTHGVFNADDEYFTDMTSGVPCTVTSYGIRNGDFSANNIYQWNEAGRLGISFVLERAGIKTEIKLPVPGEFSVLNALAAAAVCEKIGLDAKALVPVLENISVPGRFETVPLWKDRIFVIDYAHNEVSMKTLLETVRSYNPKRIVTLFGSVGERTKNRRRELGTVCSHFADFSIITSDNPGREAPEIIIDEISGYFADIEKYIKIPDREAAVRYAVRNSKPGDIVLLCGKGHENYQLIGKERVPFCERDILLDEFKKLYK